VSILVDKSTRVLVQGITGREGIFHALGKKMLAASGLNFASADEMGAGAAQVVALARSAP
jgi:succinyl-CoA synthetase alpha subunit